MKLVIGLLAPFVIVAIFLLMFSRKMDVKTTPQPPAVSPETSPDLASAPEAIVPAVKEPDQEVAVVKPVTEVPILKQEKKEKEKKKKNEEKKEVAPPVVAAPVVESEMAPIVVKKPVKKVPPVQATTTVTALAPDTGQFTIQIASFSSKEDADRLALKLTDHGHAAFVVAVEIPNKGTWYRVRVGKYQDRPSAVSAAEKLAQAEQVSFIITTH